QRVVGELLSADNTPPPEPAKPTAARRGQPEDNGGGTSLPTAAWGLLATLGLLGAGALIETRSLFG
ncbi:MAG TPA: hypothetical protein VFR04_08330, partial [Solirubrobacterales bacterium]|nr:hypothetical protein [Solirubrobacterales bacterium]